MLYRVKIYSFMTNVKAMVDKTDITRSLSTQIPQINKCLVKISHNLSCLNLSLNFDFTVNILK